MRRSFDGLAGMAKSIVQQDPLSGHLFVFFNRNCQRVKLLFWDRSGLCLYYKRLEQGVFHIDHFNRRRSSIEIDGTTLQLILDGIDLSRARRRRRFRPPRAS
jgi:transposase